MASMPKYITVNVSSVDGKEGKINGLENWELGRFKEALTKWYKGDKPYILYHNGSELNDFDDNRRLNELGIIHGSSVKLEVGITVKLHFMSGEKTKLTALENWTFKKFKEVVEKGTAANLETTILQYKGQQINYKDDNATLQDLGFVHDAQVNLVTRSTGGWFLTAYYR